MTTKHGILGSFFQEMFTILREFMSMIHDPLLPTVLVTIVIDYNNWDSSINEIAFPFKSWLSSDLVLSDLKSFQASRSDDSISYTGNASWSLLFQNLHQKKIEIPASGIPKIAAPTAQHLIACIVGISGRPSSSSSRHRIPIGWEAIPTMILRSRRAKSPSVICILFVGKIRNLDIKTRMRLIRETSTPPTSEARIRVWKNGADVWFKIEAPMVEKASENAAKKIVESERQKMKE